MCFLSPTRLHRLGLPSPSPSGQYLTYTAPMSSSSVAMKSDTCATSATALVASVSRVMGSLTVQCMAAPPPGEGVAMELSRASSMASRSGHGDAGEDDADDDARPPTKPRRGMMGRRAAWGRRGDAREDAHPPLGMRAMHGFLTSTRAPARATRDIAAHSSARSAVRSLCQIAKLWARWVPCR
mgnify:CR=1 FL=1